MPPAALTSHASSAIGTPAGTYIYAVQRASPTTLAAIASDATLRQVAAATLQPTAAPLPVPAVTALAVLDAHTLATGSRTGTVALWDTRAPAATPALALAAPSGAPVLSLAAHAGRRALAAGLEGEKTAAVVLWDAAAPAAPARAYTESHHDDVTELRFDAARPRLLSGGTDALVNVYDYTAPAAAAAGLADDDVDGALRHVVNHGSSVHKAGWLPGGAGGDDDDMWAASHDEALGVYRLGDAAEDSADAEPERREFGDVRGPLGCEYVVDALARPAGGAWVVAASHSAQWADLVPLVRAGPGVDSWELRAAEYRLAGAHGDDVVRGILMDAATSTIFTCGEDGLVKAWKPPAEEAATAAAAVEEAEPEKRRKKSKKEKREKSGRYAPY